ncbi:receptor-interacting serine threonine- kinase 4-like [Brachionus plicatilis]|uniref:Receptor-interacting serine threonine-kinase 4-like n=1 Tax=Brachionus plicatilis TaxID=10195 RepID=A0A3M7PF42_BRAPC|nr:receptor-interacting serine threonine- kinase 4-like [Brachionus plicatilis]
MMCSMIEDDSWSYSLAQNLIEKGAKLGPKDSYGFNAFMYACLYQKHCVLELFLSSPGDFSLYSKDQFGNTCFHLAALARNDSICSILRTIVVKFNQTQTIERNKFGHGPIDLCKLNNHQSCQRLDLLGKMSADKNGQSVFCKSESVKISAFDTDWHEFYKFVKNIREPLIKEYKPRIAADPKLVEDYIEFKSGKSEPKCVVTRNLTSSVEHYDMIRRQTDRAISDNRNLSSKSVKSDATDKDHSQPWRENLKNLYETLEYQNTRSFRRTMNQSPTNLFDQLSTGLLINLHLNNCMNNESRRSSLMKFNKPPSQISVVNQQALNGVKNAKTTTANAATNNATGSNIAQNGNALRRTSFMSIK